MKKISEAELQRLRSKGGVSVKRRPGTAPKTPEPDVKEIEPAVLSGTEATKSETPVLAPTPAPVIDMQPMAAMAASMAARDAQLEMVVVNNTKALDKFSGDLAKANIPKQRKPWRANVKRRKDLLIDYVDIIPMELKKV